MDLDAIEIEARDTAGDVSDDSGYDEGYLSTESIASSIYEYERENGRTYHAFRRGKYVIPNDEGEQERMDIHYHGIRCVLSNRHFFAPIRPQCVLDVGTGTGIWAIDVADDHPDATVVGVDLSPIQPSAVPPNLEFQIMDADETWTFNQHFDLVHSRLMNGFSVKSWPFFFHEAYKCMRPGGWVECQEFDLNFVSDDGTLLQDSAIVRWQNHWEHGVKQFGLTGRCYPDVMKRQMEEAGFVNVSITALKFPLGPWPKDKMLRQAGLFLLVGMIDGMSGLSARTFTQGLGWTLAEMEALLMEVRTEFKKKKIHAYLPIYVVIGQKPPSPPFPHSK